MTDLSPEAKHLLQTARESFSPTDERTAAVRRALDVRLAAARDAAKSSGAGAYGAWRRTLGISLVAGAFATFAIMIIGGHNAVPARGVAPAPASTPLKSPAPATPMLARAEPDSLQPTAAGDPAPTEILGRQETTALSAQPVARAALSNRTEPRAVGLTSPVSAPAHKRDSSARSSVANDASPGSIAAARNANTANNNASSASNRPSSASNIAPAAIQSAVADEPASAPVAQNQQPKPAAMPVPDDSLGRETALLLRARAALAKHDARTALALADEHAASFPSGRLIQERMAVRVLALCALGQVAQARAVTQELERIAPRSPHLMRNHMACPELKASPVQP
jgi:hypothetical protein